jgi:nitrite reductase/ring-hydroxylating ferredoxin subunit
MPTTDTITSQKVKVATWSQLEDRKPTYALVANVDLVVLRFDDQVSVLYGRCLHRVALLADGSITGQNLICGVHGWDYRWDSGISEYKNTEALPKFNAWVDADDDAVYVDEFEIRAWEQDNPQTYNRDTATRVYTPTSTGPPRNPTIITFKSWPAMA